MARLVSPDAAAPDRPWKRPGAARYAIERADHDIRARELIARRLAEKQHAGHGPRAVGLGNIRSGGHAQSGYRPSPFKPNSRGKRG